MGNTKNHIDYILVKKSFRPGVNIDRTRSFLGADIGSDHDLVMMTFRVRLKKAKKLNQPRIRFGLEKLRDPGVACTFQVAWHQAMYLYIAFRERDIASTLITSRHFISCP